MRFLLPTLLLASFAQAQSYDATSFSSPFVPLGKAVDAGAGPFWDDPEIAVPIGFEFPIFGVPTSELALTNLGEMLVAPDGAGTFSGLWPLSLDVADLANADESLASLLRYATEGTAPQRTFTFEWTQVGFYNEVFDGLANSTANWQVKLYESDGAIEFHFGPNTVADIMALSDGLFTTGLLQGLSFDNAVGTFLLGAGQPESPVFGTYTDIYALYYGGNLLEGMPANGQVYRFAPVVNHVEQVASPRWTVYPNPVTSGAVNFSVGGLEVRDAQGRIIAQLEASERTVDASHWSPGLYFVSDGVTTHRLVVE